MGRCTYFKRYIIVPITSLLTLGLTSFISYHYFWTFLPHLTKDGHTVGAIILGVLFAFFPIMIYTASFSIVCGDPGIVTKKMIDEIYSYYEVDKSQIGTNYTQRDALHLLTLKMLMKNGMVSEEEVTQCDHFNIQANRQATPVMHSIDPRMSNNYQGET